MERTALPAPDWVSAPESPRLAAGEIHVWRACLDLSPDVVAGLAGILAPDEQLRAKRLVKLRDRARFIAARAVLRRLLAAYVRVAPEQLQFEYGSHGKPALVQCGPGSQVSFNLSHSHGLALYAFTCEDPIGVDLEWIKEKYPVLQVARRFFTLNEVDELNALQRPVQTEAFYTTWTRKEALLKARGDGLQGSLCGLEFSTTPIEGKAEFESGRATYTFRSFRPAPRFLATVAWQGKARRLHFWEWTA